MYVISKIAPCWRELGVQLLEKESVYLFTEYKPYFSTKELHHFRPVRKLPTTHPPVSQQVVQFKLLDDNLAFNNTHDPPSYMQRSEVVSEQMQEEVTADLPTKCPWSQAVSGSCDHNEGVVTSEHGDLKLTIPEGAINEGDVVTFSIASDLYCSFVLPSKCQTDLASPYYWIGVSGSYHFHKPVQVKFEHFAVVTACDPSHYQLLCCEDDDESYTMRHVGYDLDFTVQGDISLCTYETKHFCSFCLYHGCKDPMVSKVVALYLKPDDYQYLTYFTVEVWFSLHISRCLGTNEKYYKKKRMLLDDVYSFETSCEKNSTSCFTLNYDGNFNGWEIDHSKSQHIQTCKINFYNEYTYMAALEKDEKISLFPPRFVVNVVRKSECTKDLSTAIKISLCDNEKLRETIKFKLYVPKSASFIKGQDDSLLLVNPAHICEQNKPELKDLYLYSKQISSDWKGIALHLKISKDDINIIDSDHSRIIDKCYGMFDIWFKRTLSPCWCHFTEALRKVRLYEVAHEVQKRIKSHKIA